jgi:hypothetical protein
MSYKGKDKAKGKGLSGKTGSKAKWKGKGAPTIAPFSPVLGSPHPTLTPSPEPTCSTITSDLKDDDEGRNITGGARSDPDWSATGGNTGHISALDLGENEGTWYFQAPSRFLGDFSGSCGRWLSFDLRQPGTGSQYNFTDVIIKSNATQISFNTTENPSTNWTPYSIDMMQTKSAWAASMDAVWAGSRVVLVDVVF